MAKRKITVSFNGKVIGTRQTDRTYTHALVLTDFDPVVFRARRAREWQAYGIANAQSSHRHAVVAKEPTYKYASVVSPAERANCERIAALSLDAYVAQAHADSLKRDEAWISKKISQGAQVLSYHGSRDLAFKAQAAARSVHTEYLVLVEPVDA
jgi:hypothetical protein